MEGKLTTRKSVVAFIDILGSTREIMLDEDASLNVVHDCYEFACNECKKYLSDDFDIPKIDIFSDNIVLSLPCEDLKQEKELYSFYTVITFTLFMSIYFWINGLLIRGGISIGSFFSDDIMVWGKGLVKSYKLENEIAIFPRVIIDPEYVNVFQAACSIYKYPILCEDFDGIFFIDPFFENDKYDLENTIKKIYEINSQKIEQCKKEDKKVLHKLYWFQRYCEEKLLMYSNRINIKSITDER